MCETRKNEKNKRKYEVNKSEYCVFELPKNQYQSSDLVMWYFLGLSNYCKRVTFYVSQSIIAPTRNTKLRVPK